MHRLIIIVSLLLIIVSCIKDPSLLNDDIQVLEKPYALVINEGLYGYNNASITYFSITSGTVYNNIFSKINGYSLGDVANSSIVIDSNLFVVVSTSRVLYEISLNTLKVNRILKFHQNSYPRQITYKSNYIYITDAYQNYLYKIDISSFSIIDSILVGAQPEGLCIIDNYVFVVNSGWGDINANHPEASTLYKIDLKTFKVNSKIKTFLNPVEIIADTLNKQLFVACYNLPSNKDSSGTLAVYDMNLNLKKFIQGNFSRVKLLKDNRIICLYDTSPAEGKNSRPGLAIVEFETNQTRKLLNNHNSKEFWYNFLYDQENQQIWICNALDFQTFGKVQIYNTNPNLTNAVFVKSFDTGLNPNQIILVK